MKGKKYLAKNIGLLTLSQFGTKLLSFFLVPLYTYVLTTSEYGIYDLNATSVALIVPILTLNIADAIIRFTLDKNRNREDIFSFSIKCFLVGSVIAGSIIGINYVFNIFPLLNEYPLFLFAMIAINALNGILNNFCRGLDKIKEIAISGAICSAIMIVLNLLFLLPMKLALTGYFLANIIGTFVQCIYLFYVTKAWNYISFKHKNKVLEKEMLSYSKPLMINNISWWISAASDRYIVTWLCGVAENGIYSVGYKIPSIINVFQSIFNQAWTLSAVYDFDPNDKNGFFTNIYNSYNFAMTLICSGLILSSRMMASVLYAKEFYVAWKYVPFLLMATLFGALSGYVGGIFTAVRDAKIFAKSSIIGAIINIVLNLLLVRIYGALGAAIATAVCYIVTWSIRLITVKKYISLHLNIRRDIVTYFLLVIQSILLFVYKDTVVLYAIEALIVFMILVLHNKQIKLIINTFREKGNM